MAQGAGLLNTAPSPIPGGGTNPAGMNIGIPNVSLTGLPIIGKPPTSLTPAAAASGVPTSLFPANTGGVSPTNMSGLSTGFGGSIDPKLLGNLTREFDRAFGKGTGALLAQIFGPGLFNPQVANALIAAMQPMRQRGLNDVLGSFGGEGARFSSAAAIGAGDFESQFALNEQSTLANMFTQDQMAQLQLLSSLLPTLHTEQANQGGGLGAILGGLLGIGGSIASIFPGLGSLGKIISAGSKGAAGGLGLSSGAKTPSGINIPTSSSRIPGVNPTFPTSSPTSGGSSGIDWLSVMLDTSAGASLGGDSSSSFPM